MKTVKMMVGILIALIAVLAVVVFIALKNLDSLVEMAIESVGTRVTKTAVTVNSVNLEKREWRGEIQGIVIGNPEGYAADNAIDLGRIVLQIEPQSLTEPVVVISELVIDGAKITAEHKGVADINLQDLYKNITAIGKPPRESRPTTARPDLRFMLEKVSFTHMTLDFISEEYGERALPMPEIHLSNLGDRQTGLTAEELANALLTPVIDAARKKVSSELKAKATKKLQDAVEENLSTKEKQKIDSLKSWLDN